MCLFEKYSFNYFVNPIFEIGEILLFCTKKSKKGSFHRKRRKNLCKRFRVIHNSKRKTSPKNGYTQSYPLYPQWMENIHCAKSLEKRNGCFVKKAEKWKRREKEKVWKLELLFENSKSCVTFVVCFFRKTIGIIFVVCYNKQKKNPEVKIKKAGFASAWCPAFFLSGENRITVG